MTNQLNKPSSLFVLPVHGMSWNSWKQAWEGRTLIPILGFTRTLKGMVKKAALPAPVQNVSIINKYSCFKLCKETCVIHLCSFLATYFTEEFFSTSSNSTWSTYLLPVRNHQPSSHFHFKMRIKSCWKLNQILRSLGAWEVSLTCFKLLYHYHSAERKHGKVIAVALWKAPISSAPTRLLIERIYQNCNTISCNVKQL